MVIHRTLTAGLIVAALKKPAERPPGNDCQQP